MRQDDRTIRVVTIGTWGHVESVLHEMEGMRTDEVRLVALAKALPDDDLKLFKQQFPSAAQAAEYDDYRALLEKENPDVVLVSTRLDRIAPIAADAARAGCHLICEKPLALDATSLQVLWEAVTSNGVQCIAMLDNRSLPVLAAARKAIAEGKIGKVVLCNARKSYRFGDRPAWFGRRALYGGTIPWIGVHALDFIESVSGLGFVAVAAMQSNMAHPVWPECEDNAALIFCLSNGGHATVSLDYLRPAAAATHGDAWLRVAGSRGIIEAHLEAGRCTLVTDDTPFRDLPLPAPAGFFAPWLRSLPDRGMTPTEDTRRSFRLTHACLVARDAADRRCQTEIPSGPWDDCAFSPVSSAPAPGSCAASN